MHLNLKKKQIIILIIFFVYKINKINSYKLLNNINCCLNISLVFKKQNYYFY